MPPNSPEGACVRYLASNGAVLTYHAADCFQIQRHPEKAEPVPWSEVLAADEQLGDHRYVKVHYLGRSVLLNICRSCLCHPREVPPTWPPPT
jgi:hypothetical protein